MGPILTFIVLVNAVGWLACLVLRSTFAAGHLWAFFTFVYVTVWSPTVIALALSFSFEGTSGVRHLGSVGGRSFCSYHRVALSLRCRFASACGSASYPWATSVYWRNGRRTGMERLPFFSP